MVNTQYLFCVAFFVWGVVQKNSSTKNGSIEQMFQLN